MSDRPAGPGAVSAGQVKLSTDAAIGAALAAGLVALAFVTTGGLDQAVAVSAGNTWAEIVITLLGAGACATMLLLGSPRGGRGGRGGWGGRGGRGGWGGRQLPCSPS